MSKPLEKQAEQSMEDSAKLRRTSSNLDKVGNALCKLLLERRGSL